MIFVVIPAGSDQDDNDEYNYQNYCSSNDRYVISWKEMKEEIAQLNKLKRFDTVHCCAYHLT